MKKVLFLLEDFRFGGVEVSLINLLNRLDCEKRDYQIVVATFGTHMDVLGKLVPNRRIRIKRFNNNLMGAFEKAAVVFIGAKRAEKLRNQFSRFLTVRYIQNGNFDVVIRYHHAAIKTLFTKLHKKEGQKFITWYHRSIPTDYYLKEEYLENCDTVVAVSSACEDAIRDACPFLTDKLTSVENIVPYTEILQKAAETIEPFPKDRFNIVTCARIDYEKGIDTAIEACRILKERIPDFTWYLIGGVADDRKEYGEEMDELIRAYGLSDTFVRLGAKSNPYPYFCACDLYVQPSKEEACPLTTTEAQVCGCAILATDTAGARSLIRQDVTGCVCENSAAALADAIYALYGDREKIETLKKNVRAIRFDDYNDGIVQKICDLIDR